MKCICIREFPGQKIHELVIDESATAGDVLSAINVPEDFELMRLVSFKHFERDENIYHILNHWELLGVTPPAVV